jgi:YVTN family beta-propeller protein
MLAASCSGAPRTDAQIWVSNQKARTIAIFDGATFERVGGVRLPGKPHGLEVEPGGARVWTSNISANSVTVIDASSRKKLQTIEVCVEPTQVAFAPNEAFVACGDGYMTVIDTRTLARTDRVAIGFGPHGFAAGPFGHLWSANRGGNDMSEIDPAKHLLLERHPAGPVAYAIAFSPDGRYAYVTSQKWGALVVISTDDFQILGSIHTGTDPAGVVASRDGRRIYVSNRGAGTVTAINALTFQEVATIPVDRRPDGLTLTPDGGLLFVANFGARTVSVIDTGAAEVIHTLESDRGPSDVELIPRA